MIETFTLKNFRCFNETSISPLSRINLITGRNNCGKTSFLEGLFLHLGGTNPELPLNVNAFRGVGKLVPHAPEIWGWLFNNKDYQKEITLISYDNIGQKRELHISLELASKNDIEESTLDTANKTIPEFISTNAEHQQLVLRFHAPDNSVSRVAAQLTNNQILFTRDKKERGAPFPPSIFMATRIRNYAEDAERYSRLEEAGMHDDIIEMMREVEPRLKRFVVSVTAGVPSLRADIGSQRLIPLSYMGEGMNRLLSIALAIPICQHGLLLIDEIENGLHHAILPHVFRSLRSFVTKFNVQLLATTHSWECIAAVHKVYAKNDVYDFRLFEIDTSHDKRQVIAYDQDTLGRALEAQRNAKTKGK